MRRGFTMLELAIVLSILGIFLPLGFMFARSLSVESQHAQWQLGVADSLRAVSEEMRRDERLGHPTFKAGQLVFTSQGPCSPVEYWVGVDHVLSRVAPEANGCGGVRALATNVTRLSLEAGVLTVEFEFFNHDEATRPTTVAIALGGSP